MKALIFSAGLGTRLLPYTLEQPKALVPLNGKPLLEHAIEKILGLGVTKIVVNVHHFGEQIIEYLNSKSYPVQISDERNELLETGGGLKKAATLLKGSEDVLAVNVDVLYSLDLKKVMKYHQQQQALATLVVRKRKTSRYLQFDHQNRLCGWKNYNTGEELISKPSEVKEELAFSGIQIISPEIFDLITEQGKFSIIDLYLRLSEAHKIIAYKDASDHWMDVGKSEQLKEAEGMIKAGLFR